MTVDGGNAVTEFGLQTRHHLWPLNSKGFEGLQVLLDPERAIPMSAINPD